MLKLDPVIWTSHLHYLDFIKLRSVHRSFHALTPPRYIPILSLRFLPYFFKDHRIDEIVLCSDNPYEWVVFSPFIQLMRYPPLRIMQRFGKKQPQPITKWPSQQRVAENRKVRRERLCGSNRDWEKTEWRTVIDIDPTLPVLYDFRGREKYDFNIRTYYWDVDYRNEPRQPVVRKAPFIQEMSFGDQKVMRDRHERQQAKYRKRPRGDLRMPADGIMTARQHEIVWYLY